MKLWTPYVLQILALAFFAGFGWNAIENVKERLGAVEVSAASRSISVSTANERLAAIEAKLDFIINREGANRPHSR